METVATVFHLLGVFAVSVDIVLLYGFSKLGEQSCRGAACGYVGGAEAVCGQAAYVACALENH